MHGIVGISLLKSQRHRAQRKGIARKADARSKNAEVQVRVATRDGECSDKSDGPVVPQEVASAYAASRCSLCCTCEHAFRRPLR